MLEVLRRLGSCGVSDVLDGAQIPRRLLTCLRPVTVMRPVVGRVITVQVAAVQPGAARPDRHLGGAAVDAGSDDSVIVVAVSGDAHIAGAWGGLLSLAAVTRGIRGTIVGGLCRDTDEIRELGYPVYAFGATPTTARGRLQEVEAGGEVAISGVTVRPGDYLVADSDGVVVLPATDVSAVVDAGTAMLRAELVFSEQIRQGKSLAAVLSADYEALTEPGGPGGG